MRTVKIIVEGPTGSGKPIILKEIKELLLSGGSDFLKEIIKSQGLTFEFIEKHPQ